ncbi:hypothetical protein ACWCYZ_42475 [Streptomyces virginiae]
MSLREGHCRLCWVQARAEAAATGDKPESFLPHLRHQQLFFFGMTALWDRLPKQTGPKHGRRGRPRHPDPAPAPPASAAGGQMALFEARRDLAEQRISGEYTQHGNPWPAWARHSAHRLGEARGWPRKTRLNTDRFPGQTHITITVPAGYMPAAEIRATLTRQTRTRPTPTPTH